MATTTNFGWETPDDTDLVKDGAAAIRTSLNGVDASFADLKGGTTGQVLSKASGTDLDFTWVAQDDSNAIQNAIVDAKGDLIAATGADTPARLAVGTNGQVLTADSTASTGLKWDTVASGSLTLLSTTTLNSGTTSQTISGISGSYKDLKIIIKNMKMGSTGASWTMRINSDTGSNYLMGWAGQYWGGSNAGVALGTSIQLGFRNSNSSDWNKQGYGVFHLSNYAASGQIPVEFKVINHDGGAGTDTLVYTTGYTTYNASAAVSSITLIADTNFTSGTVLIYGVN